MSNDRDGIILAHLISVMENEKTLNPWLFIWIRPRTVLRRLLDQGQKRMVIWLAVITGLLNGLSTLLLSWGKYVEYGNFRKFSIIVADLALGVLIAIAYLYIVSWLYMFVGRWIKGKGSYLDVKTAIGWSFYPWAVTAVVGIISLFTVKTHAEPILSLIYIATSIWAFVIFLKLLGEAHRFSVWRALGAVAIALFIVILIGLIIGLIITFTTGGPKSG